MADSGTRESVELSAIIPVCGRYDDVRRVYSAYHEALAATGRRFEIIYVLDGEYPGVQTELIELQNAGNPIVVVQLAKWFGEATALTVGFSHANGDLFITLPAYLQIEPTEIPKLVAASNDADFVVARRWPRKDSAINRFQSWCFHLPLKLFADSQFHDLGCGARVIKRVVTEEIDIYGDQHRFFPLLANRRGFRTIEVDCQQAELDTQTRTYGFGIYLRRLLDLLSIFFLLKFTKKPLRFFGLMGSTVFIAGILILTVITIERLFFGVGLADRPILLLGALLVVLGVQIFAIGLLGEIVIFTHAKDIKEYTVERVIN